MVTSDKLPRADNPDDALAAVVALRGLADRLERDAVDHAVAQGWSWAQVAQALGISRQAAHKKHARRVKRASTPKEQS